MEKRCGSTLKLECSINNETINITVPASARLSDIVREELHLTGTKVSCGIGRCGACAVIMDGRLVNSCLVMAYQAKKSVIQTIEGVATEDGLDPIQQAFLDEGGFQCGYCTPGMIMAVKVLLTENPNPTDEEIVDRLSGNLCRCTGYAGIIRAVRQASNRVCTSIE
ncbi:(2Fe-2S)-binding protein [Shouchella patagoniensis]|uniref:(2Fe-2S)-binding protein n=1 Tax=Shouchella patagoniensis TaxID=228576 RepID=UPI000994AFFD|nr:(2Fe-2S)-binding protein [Shouchella patagoniensis]